MDVLLCKILLSGRMIQESRIIILCMFRNTSFIQILIFDCYNMHIQGMNYKFLNISHKKDASASGRIV